MGSCESERSKEQVMIERREIDRNLKFERGRGEEISFHVEYIPLKFFIS
jgi:hypothetical protein